MSEFEKAVTGLGEECGVFGAYDVDGHDVAASVYYGLFALQHRGQESCGIAVTDTYGKRNVLSKKGLGHVDDVFDEEGLSELKGNLGWGHVEIFNSRCNTCRECNATCYKLCKRNTCDCT